MNILSLFDGISCTRIALDRLNININKYYASETDKNCIEVSKTKYPDIIHLGDVNNIDVSKLPKIDLLIGGSPCQDLSNAFKGKGLKGSRSSLFFQYITLKEKLKPKYFLLENVKNKWKSHMDKEMGVEGIEINSKYFSAQSRPRCYWTNIAIPEQHKESKQIIKDILDKNPDDSLYLKRNVSNYFSKIKVHTLSREKSLNINKVADIPRSLLKDNERQRRVYSIHGKSPTLLARSDCAKIFTNQGIRKLSPLECERLQCIPDNYTKGFSKTQRYKMIGNGFTVNVIEFILSNMNNKLKSLQQKLL